MAKTNTKSRKRIPKQGATKTHKNKTKYDRKSSKKKLDKDEELLVKIS